MNIQTYTCRGVVKPKDMGAPFVPCRAWQVKPDGTKVEIEAKKYDAELYQFRGRTSPRPFRPKVKTKKSKQQHEAVAPSNVELPDLEML